MCCFLLFSRVFPPVSVALQQYTVHDFALVVIAIEHFLDANITHLYHKDHIVHLSASLHWNASREATVLHGWAHVPCLLAIPVIWVFACYLIKLDHTCMQTCVSLTVWSIPQLYYNSVYADVCTCIFNSRCVKLAYAHNSVDEIPQIRLVWRYLPYSTTHLPFVSLFAG